MEARYKANAGAIFTLKYHLVWCPKYRRKVLSGEVGERLKQILVARANEMGITVHAMEVMDDHIHLFIESDPTRSVAEIVNRFKGVSSSILRKEFKSLRTRIPTLWSRSYFACCVGSVSEEAVKRYIEGQRR